MKANLLINGNIVMAGYINIDPYAKEGDGKISGDVSNLDHSIDDGELDEIVADSVIEYFGSNIVGSILNNWINKLVRGGKMTITTPDIYEVARSIMRREISEDDANKIIFGTNENNDLFKKNILSINRIEQLLLALGMKILSKRILGYKITIVAEKL